MQQPTSFESSCLGAILIGKGTEEAIETVVSHEEKELIEDTVESKISIQYNEQTATDYQKIIPVYQKLAKEMTKVRGMLNEAH